MKGGLCIIYTSLLTISVISSCALFILVVSDALQGEGDANVNVDLSGLHNVSQKVSEVDKDVLDTGQEGPTAGPDGEQVSAEESQRFQDNEMIIPDTLSLNSVTTDGHGDLTKPTTNSRGKIETMRKWEQLTNLLNSVGAGETKPTDKWKKVWSDLKNNTKKKAARLHRAASGTGGGPAVLAKLTDLEQRVLNLIGPQVATGLALEEAGFSQVIPHIVVPDTEPVSPYASQVEEYDVLLNQPGPSHQPLPSLVTPLQHHPIASNEDNETEEEADIHEPSLSGPQMPLSSQIVTQGSPRRSVRGSPRRLVQGSPRRVNPRSPIRSRRRSPQRVIRPARSEEAAQHFLDSDREWRQFRMNQHRDEMEMRREQNRIREMELQTQREWQAVALRGLDLIEKFVNNRRDLD